MPRYWVLLHINSLCHHRQSCVAVHLPLVSIATSLVSFRFRSRWLLPHHSTKTSTSALYVSSYPSLIYPNTRPVKSICVCAMTWSCTESEVYKVNRNGGSTVPGGAPVLHITKLDRAFGGSSVWYMWHLRFIKKKSLSLISSSLACATDNYLQRARLWQHYCHASHVWPRLCESAPSCSAICPRPGSLIREESCGKVCVSLPNALLSLQLFVRVRPQQQHQGARYHVAAGVWSVLWHCGGEKLEAHQDILGTEK